MQIDRQTSSALIFSVLVINCFQGKIKFVKEKKNLILAIRYFQVLGNIFQYLVT